MKARRARTLAAAPGRRTVRALANVAWPDVANVARSCVLVVPVGSTEQHGPHLPFTVDTEIASALAERAARTRPWMLLAPAVAYGSSGEHAGFPGTLSIGQHAVEELVVELVRSADAFPGVLVVSGHGGNAEPLDRAAARLDSEGRRVLVWSPTADSTDSHAGRTETSVMLALRPRAVRLDRAEPGDRRPLRELMPTLVASGIRAVSENGVLGDPRAASAAEGRRTLARWVRDLGTAADRWYAGVRDAESAAWQRTGPQPPERAAALLER